MSAFTYVKQWWRKWQYILFCLIMGQYAVVLFSSNPVLLGSFLKVIKQISSYGLLVLILAQAPCLEFIIHHVASALCEHQYLYVSLGRLFQLSGTILGCYWEDLANSNFLKCCMMYEWCLFATLPTIPLFLSYGKFFTLPPFIISLLCIALQPEPPQPRDVGKL